MISGTQIKMMNYAIAAILFAMVGGVAHAQDCAAIAARFNDARSSSDLDSVRSTVSDLRAAADCDADFLNRAQRITAVMLYQAALENRTADGAPSDALLAESQTYDRIWQVDAMRADLAFERGDYAIAASNYQNALQLIRDDAETPTAPDTTVIASLYRKAEETGLLAETYVPMARNRNNEADGLAAPNIRGFGISQTALPITFEFNSTVFDTRGAQAAADLLDAILGQSPNRVHLIGHTDPVGTHDYNDALSLQRAQALADFLIANGFEGEIEVQGRGKREPYQADNPDRYSLDELHRLNRRVVWVRN